MESSAPAESNPAIDAPWIRKATRPTKVAGHKRQQSSTVGASMVCLNLPPPVDPTPPPAPASTSAPAPQQSSRTTSRRPQTALQRLRQLTPPIPVRTIEEAQNAARRAKAIGSDRLIRYAVDYSKTTLAIANSLATKYNLRPEERRSCLKQLRLIRKSQRQICGEVRKRSKIGASDANRAKFLDWLDEKLESVEARLSESDED